MVLYLESRGVFWCTLHADFAVLTIWHGNIYHSEITSQKETSNQVHCFFSFCKACKYKINQTDVSFRVGELFFPCPRKNQEHNYLKKKEHRERGFAPPVLGCKTIRHKSASKETKVTRSCKMPLLRDMESVSLPLSVHLFISVPRHLRAQRRCEGIKETTVPLGMALGKYSADTKNRLVNFHSKEAGWGACLWAETYQTVSLTLTSASRRGTNVFVCFFCTKCSISD